MDASPTLDAPRQGDPITADWAARVADAANAVPRTPLAPGAFASPFGSVPALAPQPMLGERTPLPMPFDLRLVYNESTGANEAYVSIYQDTVWVLEERAGSTGGIFYPSSRSLQSGSEAADSSTGLARLPGFVDGAHNYFVVWLMRSGTTDETWDIVAQQNTNRPSWSNEERIGPVIIGEYIPAGVSGRVGPNGLRQLHRGLILYNVSWVLGKWGKFDVNYCKSIGNSSGATKVLDLDGLKLCGGQWTFDAGASVNFQSGELWVAGDKYVPTNITINGTGYTVLAKQ